MNTINRIIKDIVCKNINDLNITDTDSLFEKGIDSMNMLIILNEIENIFDIRIPDEELLISNFESINQIVKLVIKLKGNTE